MILKIHKYIFVTICELINIFYQVPTGILGTILGTKALSMNKANKHSYPHRAYILMESEIQI